MDAVRAETRLRDREAVAFLAEHVGNRHAAILIDDFAMAAATGMTHDWYRPDHVESGSIGGNDYLAGAAMGLRVRIRHHHRDRERRTDRVAGEPLVAVDDVVIALAHRAGL